MYAATLNIPTIKHLHFSPQTPTGFLPNAAVSSQTTRRRRTTSTVVSPRAVTAVESSTSISSSLYEVLRLEPTATISEIKTAYRSLAKVYHPDLSMASSSDGRDFIEIHNAYETLSDPATRAVYDLSLVGNTNNRTASFTYSGRGGFYPTRRWETDQCW